MMQMLQSQNIEAHFAVYDWYKAHDRLYELVEVGWRDSYGNRASKERINLVEG